MSTISEFLNSAGYHADRVCDYIPVVSTLSNLVDLVIKGVLYCTEQDDPPTLDGRYISHLKDKSAIKCTILLVPIVGQIIVACFDLYKKIMESEIDETQETGLSDEAFLQTNLRDFNFLTHSDIEKYRNQFFRLLRENREVEEMTFLFSRFQNYFPNLTLQDLLDCYSPNYLEMLDRVAEKLTPKDFYPTCSLDQRDDTYKFIFNPGFHFFRYNAWKDQGYQLQYQDIDHGCGIIHAAAQAGNLELLKYILVDVPNALANNFFTNLANVENSEVEVQEIKNQMDLVHNLANQESLDGCTPLQYAMLCENEDEAIEVALFFLEQGVDIHQKTTRSDSSAINTFIQCGDNCLSIALRMGHHRKLVRLLIEHGAKLDQQQRVLLTNYQWEVYNTTLVFSKFYLLEHTNVGLIPAELISLITRFALVE